MLSGIRPTGRLHLGNLLGALENWKRLQSEYECFFFIADWHALTTDYADPGEIRQNITEMTIDMLAAGLDPELCTLFVQSQVPEHAELHLLLSMITPLPWLERNPTYKELMQELTNRDLATHGFLGYPVLQAADILIYKADYVPVGVDQLPHIELTREIARRFNHLYREVFPLPEAKLTEFFKVPGTDGRKMSKSYNNCIYLSDSPGEVVAKVRIMVTDPARARRHDPGNPEVCPVFDYHKVFTPSNEREECAVGCRTAAIGCLDCKEVLLKYLLVYLAPLQERRSHLIKDPMRVLETIRDGSKKARSVATLTLAEAKEAIGI